ncbi:putative HTH-type transcriptional regulator YvbU [Labrys miyagiensis]|uniref:HTH-type transcriptional regulator YvbU n=1 Tax=Labrys miyagiensis TaxID=346912 RepID=A0ABQ6CCB7_9HYPH|nr:LysR family transcriptional regulator [Labrys miyagiensis]GLS17595.1 putative HTH-type transcriptional regulator YvbU [Labrys miyagiensis]
MHPNITFTQLRCFVAVAETGGFTSAAQRIHLTQSAVSQAIAGLEDALGAKLLTRTREGVVLSDMGEAALIEARALLAGAQRLAAVTRTSDKLAGATLRIGSVQSAAARLLPGWLKPFRALYPQAGITLHEGTDDEVTAWVLADAVDVGISGQAHPDLDNHIVANDDFVLVLPANHRLAKNASISLEALDGERAIFSGGGDDTQLAAALMAVGAKPQVLFLARDNSTIFGMVREGIGLTIMPDLTLPDDTTGLAVRRLTPTLRRDLHASTHRSGLSPAGKAFMELLPIDSVNGSK